MEKVYSMELVLEMDRSISAEHILSPGGYELRFENGATIAFDFYESISESDGKTASFIAKDLDTDAFPEAISLAENLLTSKIEEIVECYVDTEGGADINPVKILSWKFYVLRDWRDWESEEEISFSPEVLNNFNF